MIRYLNSCSILLPCIWNIQGNVRFLPECMDMSQMHNSNISYILSKPRPFFRPCYRYAVHIYMCTLRRSIAQCNHTKKSASCLFQVSVLVITQSRNKKLLKNTKARQTNGHNAPSSDGSTGIDTGSLFQSCLYMSSQVYHFIRYCMDEHLESLLT